MPQSNTRAPVLGACAALGLVLPLAGCQTVTPLTGPALNAAGYAYGAGKATQEFAYPNPVLQGAIAGALADLQVKEVRQRHDGPARIFEGTTSDGRPVTVTLRPGNGAGRVTARIGWFGDPPFSKALMERVGVRLGSLPPKAIPAEPPSAPAANPYFSRDAVPDTTMLREQSELFYLYRDTAVPRD
jgi:hypothetical protein